MKYLENERLETLSTFLSNRELGGRMINGRVEAYSCKRAGDDKKLSKVLEAKIIEDCAKADAAAAGAPPKRSRASSLGDLNSTPTRRLLIDLISTLNASFPDYDFSSVSPDSFVAQEMNGVVQKANSFLAELTTVNSTFLQEMWQDINTVMDLKECEIFSYVPDMEEDPFSDGVLWSFNYFFFNKELKRILYFTCVATSLMRRRSAAAGAARGLADEDEDAMDVEYYSTQDGPMGDGDSEDDGIDAMSDNADDEEF